MEQSDLDLLHAVPPYHLQSLAKLVRQSAVSRGQSGSSPSVSSPVTVAEVAEQLFQPSRIRESLYGLSEVETLQLRELVGCGGRANSRDLALYMASSGLLNAEKGTESSSLTDPLTGTAVRYQRPLDQRNLYNPALPLQYPTPHPHGVFEQALRRLLLLGLVFWSKQANFAGRDYASGIYDGVLIVPHAVMEVVNAAWDKQEQEQSAPDTKDMESIRAFQRMLYLYWSLVATLREGLPVVTSGLLSRSALRQVVESLSPKLLAEQIKAEQEVPHLLFIRLLLMKLELLYERRGVLHAATADAFFTLPLLERARRCYRLWLETPFWNELLSLPEVNVRPGPAPLDPAHEEVVQARQMLMKRILQEQPGVWREVPAFIARTKLYVPYLLFPRRYGSRTERYSAGNNPYGWDFRLRHGWLTHREGWHLVEGGFIRAVVSEPLQWLGLVEVNSEENPTAFRPVPGIALVTSDEPPAIEEPPRGRLIVQPNFELVALAPVSEALLVNLDRFAERVRLEHIAQYRLTKASVTRAIQVGLHAETIQQALEQAAGSELPQNVQYSLVEWERQARRVELWQGANLLEVDDAALLDTLLADEGTRLLFGRRLSPLLAEVNPHQLAAVQEVLWRRNYLPSVTAAPQHDSLLESGHFVKREPQWQLHVDGLLQPRYAVLDLYLAAEVERISERDEKTGWQRITAVSLQRGLSDGFSLEYVVQFLQHYCEGGVPASFLIRLKLWGGGYGEQQTIEVEHAPLLRLSAQILHDLRADEALEPLLGTEVAQPSHLVRVPPERLEHVIELLRERGFLVE